MPGLIVQVLERIPKIGNALAIVYVKLMSPINYALVGGIGVLINMVVHVLLFHFTRLNWIHINCLAIGLAWLWNWSNSVGPLGRFWGFKNAD